ncbi:hypothetical protein BJX96DRAFT_150190 [Aspergillus floccosus]
MPLIALSHIIRRTAAAFVCCLFHIACCRMRNLRKPSSQQWKRDCISLNSVIIFRSGKQPPLRVSSIRWNTVTVVVTRSIKATRASRSV